jgi:hypothetical protein
MQIIHGHYCTRFCAEPRRRGWKTLPQNLRRGLPLGTARVSLGNHTFGPFGLASGSLVTFRRLRLCKLFQNLRQVSRDGT